MSVCGCVETRVCVCEGERARACECVRTYADVYADVCVHVIESTLWPLPHTNTRVFPNQRRSGAMRCGLAACRCRSFLLGILALYSCSRLIVALVRCCEPAFCALWCCEINF